MTSRAKATRGSYGHSRGSRRTTTTSPWCAAGSFRPPRYLELIGRAITTVLRSPGRLAQSVAESSFDAWIKFYRQDENAPNAIVSYYAKGSLVALALDLTLRTSSGASLDDLMRALWVRHGHPGIGVPEDGIEKLASELAGHDLGDFFTRYVFGTDDPPLARLLADFGVSLQLRAATGPKDRGGKAALDDTAAQHARRACRARLEADARVPRRPGKPRRTVGRRHARGHRWHQGVARSARHAAATARRRAARRACVPA